MTNRHNANEGLSQIMHQGPRDWYFGKQLETTLRRRFLLLVATTILVGSPLFAEAGEIITYPGAALGNAPIYNTPNSLFPSLSSLTDNQVTVTGGTIGGNVYGGVTDSNTEVSGNKVTIAGGTVKQQVFGSYGELAAVTGNQVIVESGTVDLYVYGGLSDSGDVTGNSVTIKGGRVGLEVYGGSTYTGNATGNSVTIEGGIIGFNIIGGFTPLGAAVGNRVSIKGGTVEGMIYAGLSISGNATGNIISIENGTLKGDIYGSRSYSSAASGNSVLIEGGKVYGSVYGGNGYSGSATDNNVSISGMPQFSAVNTSLYGGYEDSGSGDIFTGNTLTFSAHPVSVNTILNFQYYNFTIDPLHANTGIALITADIITLGNGSGTPSTIAVVGIHSGNALAVGDSFILMQAASLSGDGVGLPTNGLAQQGIALIYDVRTDIDWAGNRVTATITGANSIDNGGPAARVNPQLKALSEGYLSGLMLTTRGADVIANDLQSAINRQNNGGLSPFILISGSHNRYSSGSHVTSKDMLMTGGLSYRQADFAIAAFIEAGWGSYDSYNSFTNAASVRGDGNNHYLGGGLFGRYNFDNGLYAEASFRAGQSRTKFDTTDIQNLATGEFAHYNLKSPYMSAHVGAGYLWALSDANTLDLSAKYLWSRLGGKNATIGGDAFHFDRITSQRVRLNGELKHRFSDTLTVFAGLGYEYEFDAEAKATTYGNFRIDAPKLKGSTGLLSLGATITSAADKNLSLDVKAQGTVGKREGGSATARVNYAF